MKTVTLQEATKEEAQRYMRLASHIRSNNMIKYMKVGFAEGLANRDGKTLYECMIGTKLQIEE